MVVDEHFAPSLGLELETYIKSGDVNGVHHLIRYIWSLKIIADLPFVEKVLDVACGAGYGSYMIAQNFPSVRVTGVDYDPKSIEDAQKNYSLPNLEYKCGDVTRWKETIGEAMFDCILSFDTVEHVIHREIMMQNVVEHVSRQGALLLSTPCGYDVTNLRPAWQYHKIEYSAARLYDFLKRYFQAILRPDDSTLPHLEVFERLKGSGIDYLLRMNPVLCRGPIVIENPYREVAAIESTVQDVANGSCEPASTGKTGWALQHNWLGDAIGKMCAHLRQQREQRRVRGRKR